jgi:hypothetical protein
MSVLQPQVAFDFGSFLIETPSCGSGDEGSYDANIETLDSMAIEQQALADPRTKRYRCLQIHNHECSRLGGRNISRPCSHVLCLHL